MLLATPLLARLVAALLALVLAFGGGVWTGWSTASNAAKAERLELAQEVIDQHIENARIQTEYHADVQALTADLDAALSRVRNRPKLLPSPPTECRAYEASPSQLSESDREFLVRLGAEADEVALRLKALQEYVNSTN